MATPSAYRQARRAIETVVRDAVVAALSAEGWAVTDLREPDKLERQRPAADFDFLLDGERVGLEVTEFALPTEDVQASAGASRVAAAVAERLTPLAADLGLGLVTVDLDYVVGSVPSKRRAAVESEPLILGIESGMRKMSATHLGRLEIGRPVPWVRSSVTLKVADPSSDHPRVVVVHGDGRLGVEVNPVVEDFIASRRERKAAQTAEYERAILGVYRGWIADAENLAEALNGASDQPWWRVYFVDRDDTAVLVYAAGRDERDDRHT
jgi:hypothetical protein